jgi:uncharacterized cupin superfamily protein
MQKTIDQLTEYTTRQEELMSLPLILQPGAGKSVQIRTSTCTFKATGKETNRHFGLFEFVMESGANGASPHIHKKLTEMFYVVEGEIELVLGDRRIVVYG